MTSEDLETAFAEAPAARSSALHVSLGAVTLTAPGTGALLATLLADGAARPLVSLDPNVRPAVMTDMAAERAALARAVEAVDLVKVSDDDLTALHPDRDPLAVAGEWARSGPALVVVTRGRDGATVVRDEGGTMTVASLPVDVVDTVGAGDAFTSGLLAALDEHALLDRAALRAADPSTLREVLAFASRVAAVTCTRHGADPPRRTELAAV
jgi:fructokinase